MARVVAKLSRCVYEDAIYRRGRRIFMIINGKKREFPDGTSVREMLSSLNLDAEKVVVEVNQSIIEKRMFAEHALNTGDKIEIIAFVGGG